MLNLSRPLYWLWHAEGVLLLLHRNLEYLGACVELAQMVEMLRWMPIDSALGLGQTLSGGEAQQGRLTPGSGEWRRRWGGVQTREESKWAQLFLVAWLGRFWEMERDGKIMGQPGV